MAALDWIGEGAIVPGKEPEGDCAAALEGVTAVHPQDIKAAINSMDKLKIMTASFKLFSSGYGLSR